MIRKGTSLWTLLPWLLRQHSKAMIPLGTSVRRQRQIAEPRLPLVDPFEDHDNVWVMLDEGCNQTCHGTKWRRHSEGVLAGYGLQFLQQKAAGTSFKGIGAARAVGKYSMPFALLISNGTGRRRDIRLQGELASTELDSPDVLCLLSLQDQVQLGLVKDLRRGAAKVSGYSGQLRLARHVRTGLLLLCVSQFGASVTERRRKFAVDTEAVVIPKRTPKRTVSIPARDERTVLNPCKGQAYLDPSRGRGRDGLHAVRARARQRDAPQEGRSGDFRSRETGVLTSFAKKCTLVSRN